MLSGNAEEDAWQIAREDAGKCREGFKNNTVSKIEQGFKSIRAGFYVGELRKSLRESVNLVVEGAIREACTLLDELVNPGIFCRIWKLHIAGFDEPRYSFG
ncbi:MAG TPA: hypothetical protein DF383_10575, partial [Deltaproteobacteria bacterium]|nr:hypothetical protein [Deltaproteobacteria bacterium]